MLPVRPDGWWCERKSACGTDRVVKIAPHHPWASGSPDRIMWQRPRITREDGPRSWVGSFTILYRRLDSASMTSLASYRLFVGIDIAAATFAAVWAPDLTNLPRAITLDQTPAGYTALVQR